MRKAGEDHLLTHIGMDRSTIPDSLDRPHSKIYSILHERSFVLCYCSIYGEDCDQTHLGAGPPEADVCGF